MSEADEAPAVRRDGTALSATVDQALSTIIERHGSVVLDDRRRLLGLLRDHCADAIRDIRLLMAAYDDGVPPRLKRAGTTLSELEIGQEARRLTANFGISADLARQAVLAWAQALGVPLPVVAITDLPSVERLVPEAASSAPSRPESRSPSGAEPRRRWLKIVLVGAAIALLIAARLVQLDHARHREQGPRAAPVGAVEPVAPGRSTR